MKGDSISGAITICFGVFFWIGSIRLGIISTTSDGASGAGAFPFIVSSFLIVFGLILLIGGLKTSGKIKYFVMDEDTKENLRPFLLTIVAIFVFLIVIKFIPFTIGLLVLLMFLNFIYKRSWKFNLIFSTVLVGFVYLLFTVILKIQFQM